MCSHKAIITATDSDKPKRSCTLKGTHVSVAWQALAERSKVTLAPERVMDRMVLPCFMEEKVLKAS